MSPKALISIGVFIGGTIGAYVPVVFGASGFSFTSIICGGIGSLIGIYAGFKLSQMIG